MRSSEIAKFKKKRKDIINRPVFSVNFRGNEITKQILICVCKYFFRQFFGCIVPFTMYSTSLESSRARCDVHKQHIFTGKDLKFLFQPAFSGDYRVGHVALECSFRRSFHSVHWSFPFGFRGIPFARESSIFFPSLSLLRLFFLLFFSRFAICDF